MDRVDGRPGTLHPRATKRITRARRLPPPGIAARRGIALPQSAPVRAGPAGVLAARRCPIRSGRNTIPSSFARPRTRRRMTVPVAVPELQAAHSLFPEVDLSLFRHRCAAPGANICRISANGRLTGPGLASLWTVRGKAADCARSAAKGQLDPAKKCARIATPVPDACRRDRGVGGAVLAPSPRRNWGSLSTAPSQMCSVLKPEPDFKLPGQRLFGICRSGGRPSLCLGFHNTPIGASGEKESAMVNEIQPARESGLIAAGDFAQGVSVLLYWKQCIPNEEPIRRVGLWCTESWGRLRECSAGSCIGWRTAGQVSGGTTMGSRRWISR